LQVKLARFTGEKSLNMRLFYKDFSICKQLNFYYFVVVILRENM